MKHLPKLIVSGCSNTYGHGLKDISANSRGMIDWSKGPSKLAWPQLLSDKLGFDVDVVNLAFPAQSNKLSAFKITETTINQNDVVVFLWTYIQRTCILNESKNPLAKRFSGSDLGFLASSIHKGLLNEVNINPRQPRFKTQLATKSWFKHQAKHGNDYDLANESMVWVAFADSYARKITNKVFHYSLNDGALLDLQRTYCVDILKDFSKEVYRMPKALDKRHPGEEAHQHMANIIYNDILKESK